jgi:hypothetical protein
MADMIIGFVNWLWDSLLALLIMLVNHFVDLINTTISLLPAFAVIAANSLPSYTVPSPGQLVDQSGFLSALNWFLPITFFLNVLVMMVAAYATYHLFGPVLRWIKLLR